MYNEHIQFIILVSLGFELVNYPRNIKLFSPMLVPWHILRGQHIKAVISYHFYVTVCSG